MHVDQSALLSCIYDTLELFLPDHPGAEAADIELGRDGTSDAICVTAGGCDFKLMLLPYGEARALGLAAQPAAPPHGVALPLPVSSRAKLEKHFEAGSFPICPTCGGEIRPGHFIYSRADDCDVHADCARPYRLTTAADAFVMLGEPMMRIRIRDEASL